MLIFCLKFLTSLSHLFQHCIVFGFDPVAAVLYDQQNISISSYDDQ
jgi:hypothetical protein